MRERVGVAAISTKRMDEPIDTIIAMTTVQFDLNLQSFDVLFGRNKALRRPLVSLPSSF